MSTELNLTAKVSGERAYGIRHGVVVYYIDNAAFAGELFFNSEEQADRVAALINNVEATLEAAEDALAEWNDPAEVSTHFFAAMEHLGDVVGERDE